MTRGWDRVWRERREGGHRGIGPIRRAGRLLVRFGDFRRLILGELRETLARHPGAEVLEAGCGSGDTLSELAGRGCSCTGIDISVDAVSLCIEGGSRGVVASVTALPFRDSCFDLVFSTGVLDELGGDGPEEALGEMGRVAAPGADVVVICASTDSRFHTRLQRRLETRGEWRFGPKRAVASLSAEAGRAIPGASVQESRRGWLLQWRFASYLLADRSLARRAFHALFYLLSGTLWFLNRLPGMVLVTRIRKDGAVGPSGPSDS